MRRRKRMLEDLDQDIRNHIEIETQDNIERGMSPEEARYAAIRKFGNVTRVKEETREVWSLVWLEQLLRDFRFALRTLRKNPGFAVTAVLILALGVAANIIVFGVLQGLVLRQLDLPIVVFSTSALMVDIQMAKKLGAVDFMAKPADQDEMIKVGLSGKRLAP